MAKHVRYTIHMKTKTFIFAIFAFSLITGFQNPVSAQVMNVCAPYNYNFGIGKSGTDVVRLQQVLISRGYLAQGLSTGYYGSLTLVAVKKLQAANGISPTGFIGPITRALLPSLGCGNTIPPVNSNPVPNSQFPTITSISPASGPYGTNVTIYGTNFNRNSGNSINFANAQNVKTAVYSPDGTSMQFTIPATPCSQGYSCAQVVLNPGYYPISVHNGIGTSNQYNFQVTSDTTPGGPNPNPVINSVEGPTTLAVGQQGSWTVRGSNSGGGNLMYTVIWGDEVNQSGATAINDTFLQSTTFTHAYQNPGTYTARFTVRNNTGREVTSSITVQVAGNTTQNAPTITSISPSTGRFGNPVTITGTNFNRYDNIVNFGNIQKAAMHIPSYDGKTLQFTPTGSTCPADAYVCTLMLLGDGQYAVSVTTDRGTSNALPFIVATNSTSSNMQNPTLALRATAQVGTVLVTPEAVTEDSRCPTGVTCVQAGRVLVPTTIQSSYGFRTITMSSLGNIFTTEDGYKVQMVDVTPGKTASSTIPMSDYRITYKIWR